MTAFPVLLREFRVEARRPTNHWLRVLGAVFMVIVFAALMSKGRQSASLLGALLFPKFHTILFLGIVFIAPLLTADCLAQEKREGTLPLLLLTRLTAGGIVMAKMMVHTLRGLALVLAALPILRLPFLIGGVGQAEIDISMWLCFSALCIGLAAGVVASSLSRAPTRAAIVALGTGLGLSAMLALGYAWCFQRWLVPLTWSPGSQFPSQFGVWQLLTDYNRYWPKALAEFGPGGMEAWMALVKVFAAASALVGVVLIQLAGWAVRESGVERAVNRVNSFKSEWLHTPQFWRALMARRWRRQLGHNPVYWLQQRTWSARIAKWGWCAAVLVAELLLRFAPSPDVWLTGQFVIGLALMFGMIYAAASSYRYERRNGILELIMVTPLKPWRLVSGRVRWLWIQFMPACLFWFFAAQITRPTNAFADTLLRLNCFVFAVWLMTPVIGLDCTVNFRGHWRAILGTAVLVLVVPGAVFLFDFADGWSAPLLAGLILWIIGLITTISLEWQMRNRRFRYLHPHVPRRHRRRKTRRQHSTPAAMIFSPYPS